MLLWIFNWSLWYDVVQYGMVWYEICKGNMGELLNGEKEWEFFADLWKYLNSWKVL